MWRLKLLLLTNGIPESYFENYFLWDEKNYLICNEQASTSGKPPRTQILHLLDLPWLWEDT
jgi:hypothetical protein